MQRRLRRLAVVFVALLTLGGLSAVPSQAATGSATFTGTVTAGAGTPAKATIALDPQSGVNGITRAHSDSTGHWSATVPPGDYTVWVGNNKQYIYAYNTTDPQDAQVFHAAAGTTTVVDQRLPTLAHVRGQVLDKITGAPIEGVSVSLADPSDPSNPAVPTAYGTTDATGHFVFATFAFGNMAISLYDTQGRYLAEYSGDTQTLSLAKTKPVTEGGSAFFQVRMTPAATLTGRIVKGTAGRGVRGASITVYAGRSDVVVGAGTPDSDGNYSVGPLPAGPVTVLFTAVPRSGLQSAWYLNADSQATATQLTLTGGQVMHLQNQVLVPVGG